MPNEADQYITREEFERLWGYVPPGDALGVKLVAPQSGNPVINYRFVGQLQEDVAELERVFKL